MFASKFSSLILAVARPAHLARFGVAVFLLTVLFLRLPSSVQETVAPVQVGAQVVCSSGCESAGHCWPAGTHGGNGVNGCKYVCDGRNWGQENCNTSQEEKQQFAALHQQYEQQVAAAGGGGSSSSSSGGSSSTKPAANPATTCAAGAGSASGCAGRPFYSPSTTAPTMLCFPVSMNPQGLYICGRNHANQVDVTINPATGKAEGGFLRTTASSPNEISPSGGGCYGVITCGCSNGSISACLNENNSKLVQSIGVSKYCVQNVCAPVGSVTTSGQVKVCTPGQVSECLNDGTSRGKICNTNGTGWNVVHAHACGARHTVAICANVTGNSATGGQCQNQVTYDSVAACNAANPNASCGWGVSYPAQSEKIVNASCESECGLTNTSCIKSCQTATAYLVQCLGAGGGGECSVGLRDVLPSQTSTKAIETAMSVAKSMTDSNVLTGGECAKFGSYSTFVGCGTGTQALWNCYQSCNNGTPSRTCRNEPGLSCGAHESNVVSTAIAKVETRFTAGLVTPPPQTPTQNVPTPPPSTAPAPSPSPVPTPTPAAVCGQPCGPSAGGAYCSGSNQACVSGTCRSTLCAPSEQNNQCVCASPPPNPPICVDIFASKTNIGIGDEVSFTCAQVANAERYEFRWGYTTKREGTEGLQMQDLAPSSVTSRTSAPITADKVGRYIAQCRPCAANGLCSEWEPLTNTNSEPELEPGVQVQSESVEDASLLEPELTTTEDTVVDEEELATPEPESATTSARLQMRTS